jgi:nicotinic acid mononucleotide adenylyltransferase
MTKAYFSVGRFQPPTIGHERMIREVMNKGGDAFVFVSSATKSKEQNPLTVEQKINALQAMFPVGVTFVNTNTCKPRCAGPVAANDYLRSNGYTDITLIAGSDRAPEFGSEANMWKTGIDNGIPAPKFIGLQRSENDPVSAMSGTKARELARDGKYEEFAKAVKVGSIDDAGIRRLYDAIRAVRGGKKTRRSTKSRASGKALYRRGLRSRSGSSRTSRS